MLLTLLPGTAAAQLSVVEKLFDNFTDFGVFVTAARYAPNSALLTAGKEGTRNQFPLLLYGAEFSWQIAELKEPVTLIEPRTCVPDPSSIKEVRVTRTGDGRTDTTIVYGALKCTPESERSRWLFEMALAYVQSTPVYGRDPALRLRGVYREVPRIAIYGTFQPPAYSPYFGLFFGLIKLDDLRMTGSDATVITGSAESAAVGAGVGVASRVVPVCSWIRSRLTNSDRRCELPFNYFVEADYSYSSFPTIKWSRESGWLPGAPRGINLSNVSVSFGLQLTVKDKK